MTPESVTRRLSAAAIAAAAAFFAAAVPRAGGQEILTPVVDGEWWHVAGDPDLGEYTRERQQPVDFAVWQAADGTWQLWSCIRGTGCGEHTRLFYRWEGQNLTDANWRPMGIAMEARPELGESPGGLQAPHVVRHQGLYHMAYGDWVNICFATSKDGKTFERVIQPDGKTGVFSEGPGCNTRDAMLIQIDGLWHCYYTAYPHRRGYGFCRTSPDLKTWSNSCVVSYGGQVGPGATQNECPHVVELEPGLFYFFRNQYYGERARNWVYWSRNPLNFGIDDDSRLVRSWHVAAPEIIRHEGQYYVASLLDSLKGIKIAKLKWVKLPEIGQAVFDFDSAEARDAWTSKGGDLASVFTSSTRSNFEARTDHFIATAELGDGRYDDDRRGIIESPAFTIDKESYILFVSGGDDSQKVCVVLVDAENGNELARLTGENDNAFRRAQVGCPGSADKKAFIRIVDDAAGPWGHINFGGIYEDPLADYPD
jgi:hypothetical protein